MVQDPFIQKSLNGLGHINNKTWLIMFKQNSGLKGVLTSDDTSWRAHKTNLITGVHEATIQFYYTIYPSLIFF